MSTKVSLDTINSHITIYRKCVTHLGIRDEILSNNPSEEYMIGPTILYIPQDYVNIITENKSYKNYVYINSQFKLPEASKGTIFIKMSNEDSNVHLCAYTFKNNKITIFDPAWHPVDKKGEYSEDEFYDDLKTVIKKYKPKYQVDIVNTGGSKSIQSVLNNDIFCQSWSLKWLLEDGNMKYPNTEDKKETITKIIEMIKELHEKASNASIFEKLPNSKWDIDAEKITEKMKENKWKQITNTITKRLTEEKIIDLYDQPDTSVKDPSVEDPSVKKYGGTRSKRPRSNTTSPSNITMKKRKI